MRIGEQIDALELMGLHPFRYLIVPNLLAGLLCLPLAQKDSDSFDLDQKIPTAETCLDADARRERIQTKPSEE